MSRRELPPGVTPEMAAATGAYTERLGVELIALLKRHAPSNAHEAAALTALLATFAGSFARAHNQGTVTLVNMLHLAAVSGLDAGELLREHLVDVAENGVEREGLPS